MRRDDLFPLANGFGCPECHAAVLVRDYGKAGEWTGRIRVYLLRDESFVPSFGPEFGLEVDPAPMSPEARAAGGYLPHQAVTLGAVRVKHVHASRFVGFNRRYKEESGPGAEGHYVHMLIGKCHRCSHDVAIGRRQMYMVLDLTSGA